MRHSPFGVWDEDLGSWYRWVVFPPLSTCITNRLHLNRDRCSLTGQICQASVLASCLTKRRKVFCTINRRTEGLTVSGGTLRASLLRGAGVARSVKCLTLDFGSGHDLAAHEFEPHVALCAGSAEPRGILSLCLSLSLCPSPTCILSLSLKVSKLKRKDALC